jgi:four helix bundle protein
MSTFTCIEEIDAWREARQLAIALRQLSTTGSFARDFPLRDQINRASGSIMDNIAEGFEREGNKEFIHFLSYSRGSCGEVRSQLYRAFDREYNNKRGI